MGNLKYSYTNNCREISGFGGGYEEACRKMVISGMLWFDENPSANPKFHTYKNVYGIVSEDNPKAESLTDTMAKSVGNNCTGAMMQAAVSHVLFAAKHGWEEYIKEMEKKED
ncbi:MAG: hypothetical protein LBS20_19465 [Prevotella sp.]|jgi:hypothetical protein|nr:hypothetical protein [Prevotella sp.]